MEVYLLQDSILMIVAVYYAETLESVCKTVDIVSYSTPEPQKYCCNFITVMWSIYVNTMPIYKTRLLLDYVSSSWAADHKYNYMFSTLSMPTAMYSIMYIV